MLFHKNKENNIKRRKLKDTIKLNDNSYIKVERKDEYEYNIYQYTYYEHLFDEGHEETRIELVPKKDVDSADILNSMKTILEKLENSNSSLKDKLTMVSDDLSHYITNIDLLKKAGFTLDNTFGDQLKEHTLKIISDDKKEKLYKEFFKSDYFKNIKRLDIFKGKTDIEVADIIFTILSSFPDSKPFKEKVINIIERKRKDDV